MEKSTSKFKSVLFGSALVLVIIFMNSSIFGIGGEKANTEEDSGEYVALEQVLMQVKGVGEVVIYIHSNDSEEMNPLSDYFSLSTTPKSEARTNKVEGILVVAEGAKDPGVKNELSKVLSSVLQLPEHRIVIVEMKKRGNLDENK